MYLCTCPNSYNYIHFNKLYLNITYVFSLRFEGNIRIIVGHFKFLNFNLIAKILPLKSQFWLKSTSFDSNTWFLTQKLEFIPTKSEHFITETEILTSKAQHFWAKGKRAHFIENIEVLALKTNSQFSKLSKWHSFCRVKICGPSHKFLSQNYQVVFLFWHPVSDLLELSNVVCVNHRLEKGY